MTEGRSTGFPKIYASLRANGSPDPIFETDEQNQYFLATIKIHPAFLEENVLKDVLKDVLKQLTDRQKLIISFISKNDEITQGDLSQKMNVSDRTIRREIAKLTEWGVLSRKDGRKAGHWKVNDAYITKD